MTQTTEEILESLRDEVANLVGNELIFDYTKYDPEEGKVVDAYVAQADIDKGITIRGEYAFTNYDKELDSAEETESVDIDLCCINKKHIGSTMLQDTGLVDYTLEEYLKDIQKTIQEVKAGVYVRSAKTSEDDYASIGIPLECAF